MGVGILIIPSLGYLLNFFKIPIFWPIFLFIALTIFFLRTSIYTFKEPVVNNNWYRLMRLKSLNVMACNAFFSLQFYE